MSGAEREGMAMTRGPYSEAQLARLEAACAELDWTAPAQDRIHPGYTIDWVHVRGALSVFYALHGGTLSCDGCKVCATVLTLPGPWHRPEGRREVDG